LPIGMPPSAWRVLLRAHGIGPHSREGNPRGVPSPATTDDQGSLAIDEYRGTHPFDAFEKLPRSWKDCLELHSKYFVENFCNHTKTPLAQSTPQLKGTPLLIIPLKKSSKNEHRMGRA
jgi:hypothetical protein